MPNVYTIASIAIAAVFASVLFCSRTERVAPQWHSTRTAWRWVPLVAAIVILVPTPLTLGAGILLAPLGMILTYVAAKRVSPRGGAAFWIGASLNVWLTCWFLVGLAIVAHDQLIASSAAVRSQVV